jgi:hypothetical protein
MRNTTTIKRHLYILLLATCIQVPLAHAALIELQPSPLLATTGDSILLNLVVSGLGTDSLGAFDISVGFDSSALSFTSYSLGNYLGNVNLLEAIDGSVGNTGGAVNVAEVSLLPDFDLDTLQPGAFTLATLNFNVINLAVGTVTQLSVLSGPVLGDALGSPIVVTGLGSASVGTVPIPGTLALLTGSMLGWLTLKRRQFAWYRVQQAEIKLLFM